MSLRGSFVTIDSIGCQTDIAETNIEQNAHYVLALKGNHGKLYEQVGDFFDIAKQRDDEMLDAQPHASCEKTTDALIASLAYPVLRTLGRRECMARLGTAECLM